MKKILALVPFLAFAFSACSHGPTVKQQAYATLRAERTYDSEFPAVWKAVEVVFSKYQVTNRDPKNVDALELKELKHRSLDSDWVYGQSRDKYQEYKLNGLPQKKYLQTRIRYHLDVDRAMGGTHVAVTTAEEIETLDPDGTSRGYSETEAQDTSRQDEILEKIRLALLSAAP